MSQTPMNHPHKPYQYRSINPLGFFMHNVNRLRHRCSTSNKISNSQDISGAMRIYGKSDCTKSESHMTPTWVRPWRSSDRVACCCKGGALSGKSSLLTAKLPHVNSLKELHVRLINVDRNRRFPSKAINNMIIMPPPTSFHLDPPLTQKRQRKRFNMWFKNYKTSPESGLKKKPGFWSYVLLTCI